MLNRIKKIIDFRFNRSIDKSDITMNELNNKILRGAILLDVRSPQEFREGHIEGAINIPEYDLKKRVKKEIKDYNKEIIVYCSTGSRSKKSKKILEKLGYNNVYNLYNGYENY